MGALPSGNQTLEKTRGGDRPSLDAREGFAIPRPALFGLLSAAGRVAYVCASAGSGKTVLVRSWIAAAGVADTGAWVSVTGESSNPQAFWLSVADALRRTRVGSQQVREMTAAPQLDGRGMVERLVNDLSALGEPLWLVIDDLHELDTEHVIPQLAQFVLNTPGQLRFIFLTRQDLPLGLHRLRLEGEVTDIRGEDLRFTNDEARALLERSGVRLSDGALNDLVSRTEGWAAGLRLAALSMARHPEPERFATGFGGHERSIAEYLFAEVLQRQPEEVSRLLLRTSILERVSGPLADHLTQSTGGARMLSELDQAGAFVVALGPEQEWYRYHHLFKDLLSLELQRQSPDELTALHGAAAEWHAERGDPLEAIRHAQAGGFWDRAARLLTDHWFGLYLDGRQPAANHLVTAFPARQVAADAELAAITAFNEWAEGSMAKAERHLSVALHNAAAVPDERQEQFQIALAVVRLSIATARNDVDAVAEAARELTAPTTQAAATGLGSDLYALAQAGIGTAQIWAGQQEAAERQLELALAEARRSHRPVLECHVLAHWALVALARSLSTAEQRAREAIEVAQAHGWEERTSAAVASLVMAVVMLLRGRFDAAASWLLQADNGILPEGQPTTTLLRHGTRALLEFACGRYEQALAAYRAEEWGEEGVVARHLLSMRVRLDRLTMLIRLGRLADAQQALDDMDDDTRDTPEVQMALATLRIAQDDPADAVAALAPVIEGTNPPDSLRCRIQALVLMAAARDAMGDGDAAANALEHALDLAEPDGVLLPFLLVPVGDLLARHKRSRTTHASLIADAMTLSGQRSLPPRPQDAEFSSDTLSEAELRVLRYLPTNMQAEEIAGELFVSVNTVRTHMRHLYSKLGVHRRGEAVEQARLQGLLSPARSQG
jgi:LuxR family transcriptional regulator, maltose regulon positive regulatory protein